MASSFDSTLASLTPAGPLSAAELNKLNSLNRQYEDSNAKISQITLGPYARAYNAQQAYLSAHPDATPANDAYYAKLVASVDGANNTTSELTDQNTALFHQILDEIAVYKTAAAQDKANADTASQVSAASTAQSTAAANDAAAKQTAVDTANQSAFPNTDKMLGVSGNSPTGASPDALTDVSTSFLGIPALGSILGLSPSAKLNTQSVKATKTSATCTPKAGAAPNTPSVPDDTPLQLDSYRYGSKSLTADGIQNPRSVGERANDKDDLAYLRLTIDPSANSSAKGFAINAYSRFFLQSWQESQQEKVQIVETFSNYYAYFFGKRPVMYRYNGILLNDMNNEWANDLVFYYENYFRGSQATALSGIASITYDGKTVTGFFTGISMSAVAENDKLVTFSLDMLVVDHTTTRYSPDINQLIATRTKQLAAFASSVQSFITNTSKGATSTALGAVNRFSKSKVAGNGLGIASGKISTPSITNLNLDKQDVIATATAAISSAASAAKILPN